VIDDAAVQLICQQGRVLKRLPCERECARHRPASGLGHDDKCQIARAALYNNQRIAEGAGADLI